MHHHQHRGADHHRLPQHPHLITRQIHLPANHLTRHRPFTHPTQMAQPHSLRQSLPARRRQPPAPRHRSPPLPPRFHLCTTPLRTEAPCLRQRHDRIRPHHPHRSHFRQRQRYTLSPGQRIRQRAIQHLIPNLRTLKLIISQIYQKFTFMPPPSLNPFELPASGERFTIPHLPPRGCTTHPLFRLIITASPLPSSPYTLSTHPKPTSQHW